MSRRFCCEMWCGVACLTIGLAGNLHGADGIAAETVGTAIRRPGRVAMAPQIMDSTTDGTHVDSGHMHGSVVEPPMAEGAYCVS